MSPFSDAVIKPGPLLTKFAQEQAAILRLQKSSKLLTGYSDVSTCRFPDCDCNLLNNGHHRCPKETTK